MAAGKGGTATIPWYATVFRAEKFELALAEIAPVALRYGASDYAVYRMRDDRYRFVQYATFEDPGDFEAYWYGPEFAEWRADHTSWFTVPIVYSWFDRVTAGALQPNGVT
jgi:quinol monooxygenase YgiN